MIPLIPALALAFLSFIASAFVILRIIIPILPPHPLSRRVAPSEFGLPNFRSLSPADKTHLWLASFDLLALAIFIWQAVMESLGGPSGFEVANDVGSSLRLWFAMTIRQTFLLVAASITLLHVRMGRSVSFGSKHWVLWAPTVLLAATSTALAGVLTGAGVRSFFVGLLAYSSTVAVLSSSAFCCLIGTLAIIRRNLAKLNDTGDWPPPKQVEEKPRPSFATEEIDALRDGSSWITSNASSRPGSVSNWSFSTHQTRSNHGHVNQAKGSHPSTIPPKSSFWFNPATPRNPAVVPPVPPLPSPYRHSAATVGLDDPDPFRRDVPGLPQRSRMGSQSSWLTSPSASQVTLSQWSYPPTHASASTPDLLPSTAVSRPVTPALANAQVLGGYGYSPQRGDSEQALASLAASPDSEIDVSVYRAIGWLLTIWIPFGLTLPYVSTLSLGTEFSSNVVSILLILSVTMSSPILAVNILFRSPMPIPQGIFDNYNESPSQAISADSSSRTSLAPSFAYEYKRSASVTVVESRRSTDVWLSKGEAVGGKGKLSRAMSMLAPSPKLSMLPPDERDDGETTPPLPIQRLEETPVPCSVPHTPHSNNSAELGKIKKISSGPENHSSDAEESLGYQSKIMVAQRHYSAMAQTVVLPASPDREQAPHSRLSSSTAIAPRRNSSRPTSHIRTRSNSSITHAPSPPPPFPLPPTPPSVQTAKTGHRKSCSSGFSLGVADGINEIDALSAGVLPMLVPGLKVGKDMHVRKDWDFSPPATFSKGSRDAKEFGLLMDDEFESPELHSTPAKRGAMRPVKTSVHKRNHFSLPSLGLGKDGAHSLASWKAEVSRALESKTRNHLIAPVGDADRRNTVCDSVPTAGSHLNIVREEDEAPGTQLGRNCSTQSRGQCVDTPIRVEPARNSVTALLSELQGTMQANQPHSAASTATLFEFDANAGPQAQSTPPFQKTSPLSLSKQNQPHLPMPNSTPNNRRSSIVYIKSDDSDAMSPPYANPTPTTSTSAFAQWSSRAARPLMPKASKLQRKMSDTKPGSPGGGLRRLSLLQDRDTNAVETSPGGTRPLLLGKKQLKIKNENATPGSAAKSRVLKPLQLARSETSKLRGILRKDEVLPNVVVRPPSTTEHGGFAYNFR